MLRAIIYYLACKRIFPTCVLMIGNTQKMAWLRYKMGIRICVARYYYLACKIICPTCVLMVR